MSKILYWYIIKWERWTDVGSAGSYKKLIQEERYPINTEALQEVGGAILFQEWENLHKYRSENGKF